MQTGNNQSPAIPLYKRLDEMRTKGEWSNLKSKNNLLRIYSTDEVQKTHVLDCFSFSSGIREPEAEANASFTVLAVNNLSHLAEALGEWVSIQKELLKNGVEMPKNLSDKIFSTVIKSKRSPIPYILNRY